MLRKLGARTLLASSTASRSLRSEVLVPGVSGCAPLRAFPISGSFNIAASIIVTSSAPALDWIRELRKGFTGHQPRVSPLRFQLRRWAGRALLGLLLPFVPCSAAFSQQIPCPVASDFTLNSVAAFNAVAPCVVNFGVTLFNTGNDVFDNEAGATLINDGSIRSNPVAVFNNDAGGTVTNFGTIFNSFLTTLNNAGTLTNAGGANLFLSGSSSFTNTGTFNNAGGVVSDSTTTLINAGTLTNFVGALVLSDARINNTSGATLTNDGTLTTSHGLTNNAGAMLIVNGKFSNIGPLTNAGVVNIQAGGVLNNLADISTHYTQTSGQTVVNGTLNSAAPVQIQGGTLTGVGTIKGDVNNSGGSVSPGDAPGMLTINGNYTQGSGGTLTIQLGGRAQGDFSVLDVTGVATLGGAVNFVALGGFTPEAGDEFTFLLFGQESGDFANVEFTNWTCPVGDTCTDVFGPNNVTLEIRANVPEPSSLVLLCSGLLAIACAARKRLHRRQRGA
jgi:PEP-CTERM motif